MANYTNRVGFYLNSTHHLRTESCQVQSALTTSICRCPSCPLPFVTRNALPFGPSFLEATNFSPTYVLNWQSWCPSTMQSTCTQDYFLVSFFVKKWIFCHSVLMVLNGTTWPVYVMLTQWWKGIIWELDRNINNSRSQIDSHDVRSCIHFQDVTHVVKLS